MEHRAAVISSIRCRRLVFGNRNGAGDARLVVVEYLVVQAFAQLSFRMIYGQAGFAKAGYRVAAIDIERHPAMNILQASGFACWAQAQCAQVKF